MDWLIFLGFILTGIIIGYPLGFIFGKRAVYGQIEIPEEDDVLAAEYIGERV